MKHVCVMGGFCLHFFYSILPDSQIHEFISLVWCFCKYQACDFSFKITCADEILTLVADTLDGIPSVTPLYQTHSRSVSTSTTSILFIVNMITTQYALNTSLQLKLHELREHTITTIIYISLMDHDLQV